ncbi:OmpA family protein [Catenovulum sp. SM1970]|uniref:flagellar protein MotY n=1 Tax=Marinifaba aquimaris TaxID=2741323 RepID=UPI001572579B|nr:OmpA family protein [Marinifaba aquimaris]NTS77864.1 OmpA family protein [Marinifaba aquimaris]
MFCKLKLSFVQSSLVSVLLFSSMQGQASVRHYQAKLENSDWQLSASSKLTCSLSHSIPRFGDAVFSSHASKEDSLEFGLDMLKMPANYDVASVESVPPQWRPGSQVKYIADMKLLKQFDGEVPYKAAWTMLTELEKGMLPTIYYADWHNPYDKVAVSLNTINFHRAYEAFLHCRDQLLPFNLEDIRYTVLHYKLNSDQLTKTSAKRLAMIGDYLNADPTLEFALVSAYTDSHGGRWHNQVLSQKRADSVKNFLVEQGVEAGKIESTGLGEKRHIASNKDVLSRAKNRRVVIQLGND